VPELKVTNVWLGRLDTVPSGERIRKRPETGKSTVPSGGGVPCAPRVKAKSNSGSAAAIGP
jgi:hypothetical protein